MRSLVLWLVVPVAAFAIPVGCGGDDTSTTSPGNGGGGAAAGGSSAPGGSAATGGGGAGGQAVGGGGASSTTSASSSTASAGGGGAGGSMPNLAAAGFTAIAAIPSGDSLLIDDATPMPQRVVSVSLDGSKSVDVFSATSVFDFDATPDGARVAFSSYDVNDATDFPGAPTSVVLPAWLYDASTQTISNLSWSYTADVLFRFGPKAGNQLYVSRVDGIDAQGARNWPRIGRIDLTTLAYEALTPEDPRRRCFYPEPVLDESSFFHEVQVDADHELDRAPVPAGAATTWKTKARFPTLSPDGSRIAFIDTSGGASTLHAADLDGGNDVVVAQTYGFLARYSPDGSHLAFLRYNQAGACSDVMTAKADGSESAAPTRVLDCGASGRQVNRVVWIHR